jgi:hypothetical protein
MILMAARIVMNFGFFTASEENSRLGCKIPLRSGKVLLASFYGLWSEEMRADFYCLTDRSQYSRAL